MFSAWAFTFGTLYFYGSYRDSKQKISYRDIRKILAIHDIMVISHRSIKYDTVDTVILVQLEVEENSFISRR